MGIIVSFLFIFGVIGLATFLEKQGIISGEASRKFIHVGVAHWWFIAMLFFTSPLTAAIIPAAFVVINFLSYRYNFFKSMERDGGLKDLGTVYYALSLLILALWSFGIGRPEIGGLGILAMGYADGFAAVFGEKYGRKTYSVWGNKKSYIGSLTAFIFSLGVIMFFDLAFGMSLSMSKGIILALLAAILEAISPLGTDNLTVPLGVSFLYYLITMGV